jgi:cysteine desulfurase
MDVYFDNAATTSVSETAVNAMLPYLKECYGNPSSLHAKGQVANQALDEARLTVANLLGAAPNEIYFTSGGSEADNWIITQMAYKGLKKGKNHLISTAFEHHAVLHTLKKLEKEGFEVTLLPVHEDGIVRPEELDAAITDKTALVTIMYANNEIGTIQPIKELAEVSHKHGVFFHTDAVQAVAHVSINVKEQGIDALSLSGHKFHGVKGTGALYCKKGTLLGNLIEGGAQERGRRAGTENIPGIVAMAAAMQEACDHLEENTARVTAMRDKLIAGVLQIPNSRLNGHPTQRLPGNTSFCFEGVEGESLLLRLDLAGVCASSGSACTSGSLDPSHVLLAIGLPVEVAHGSLRLTLDEVNTEEEVDYVLSQLPGIVRTLRNMSPVWEQMVKDGQAQNY